MNDKSCTPFISYLERYIIERRLEGADFRVIAEAGFLPSSDHAREIYHDAVHKLRGLLIVQDKESFLNDCIYDFLSRVGMKKHLASTNLWFRAIQLALQEPSLLESAYNDYLSELSKRLNRKSSSGIASTMTKPLKNAFYRIEKGYDSNPFFDELGFPREDGIRLKEFIQVAVSYIQETYDIQVILEEKSKSLCELE